MYGRDASSATCVSNSRQCDASLGLGPRNAAAAEAAAEAKRLTFEPDLFSPRLHVEKRPTPTTFGLTILIVIDFMFISLSLSLFHIPSFLFFPVSDQRGGGCPRSSGFLSLAWSSLRASPYCEHRGVKDIKIRGGQSRCRTKVSPE